MRSIEIEAWALRLIERILSGANVEDSRVELKATWPSDRNKAARRIAGLCNANAGDKVLWVVGVDEKTGPTGVKAEDLATWWPSVAAEFDGATPRLQDVSFHSNSVEVAALLFHTEQAPYVVRNVAFGQPGGGAVSKEVPWRDGTSIRSASRADLLRILLPASKVPKLDLMRAEAYLYKPTEKQQKFDLSVTYYAHLSVGDALVLPTYQAKGWIRLPGSTLQEEDLPVTLAAGGAFRSPHQADNRMHTVHQGEGQVILDGPGFFRVNLTKDYEPNVWPNWISTALDFGLTARPAVSDVSIVSQISIPFQDRDESAEHRKIAATWRFAG